MKRQLMVLGVVLSAACGSSASPTQPTAADPGKAPYVAWQQAADNFTQYRFELLINEGDRRRVDAGCWWVPGSPDAMCAAALPQPLPQSWLRVVAVRQGSASRPSAPIPSFLFPIDGLKPLADAVSGDPNVPEPRDLQVVAANSLPKR